MTRTASVRTRGVSPILGAVALCLILAFFVAAPSTWGTPTTGNAGMSLSTSTPDVLTAPHALAPRAPREGMILRVAVLAIIVAAVGTAVVGCTRHGRRAEGTTHGSCVRTWVQRRGPPRFGVSSY